MTMRSLAGLLLLLTAIAATGCIHHARFHTTSQPDGWNAQPVSISCRFAPDADLDPATGTPVGDFMLKLIVGTFFLAFVILVSMPAMSPAEVNISIVLPPPIAFSAPPALIVLPDSYVYVVPDIEEDIFFYDGWWWREWDGRWYRSHYYDRGWRYYRSVPTFYYDVDPGWRRYYRDRNWYGHRWDYERIPHHRLQRNWKSWKNDRHWERRGTWGVQSYQPRPHQQRQELRQQRQQQYQQRPEVQKQRQPQERVREPQRLEQRPQVQQPQRQHEERVRQPQRQDERPQERQPQRQPQQRQQPQPKVKPEKGDEDKQDKREDKQDRRDDRQDRR